MFEGYQLALNFLVTHPGAIISTLIGLILGLLIGALPGLTGPAGVAMLIPLTFSMNPITGIVMLTALYCGSTFGGAITAVLFNIPGDPQNACTTLDGYPMAKQGQAGKALGAALGGGAMAGVFSVIVLAMLAPPLANVGLAFGPAEYFALAMMGISVISAMESASVWKGLVSGLLGIVIATGGIDPLTGYGRFTFGLHPLMQGIDFMVVVIGTFAITEVLMSCQEEEPQMESAGDIKVSIEFMSLKEWLAIKWTLIRSFFIGLFIGILPGVGATTASFVSYSEAVRWSKHPEKFGTGIVEGVVASEAGANGAVGGAMVPLLALGIPGSATAAILIGALTLHGVRPGPLMMVEQKEMVYSIFVTMFIAYLAMIVFGIWTLRVFVKILNVDYSILAPIILILCVIGVFTLRNSVFDVMLSFGFGIVGYFMRKYQYPIAPMIIGLVLGPLAEVNFRRAFIMSDFNLLGVILRPITAVLLLISLASVVYAFWKQYLKYKKLRAKLL
ncbi:MAG: tripartite tricarboxylate transporter permease [Firmicutes bacterium]|nr:tripartite tricarboxylate transporter permease [Bacillota bacterium]